MSTLSVKKAMAVSLKIRTFSSTCRHPALTLDDPPCFSAPDTVFAQQALRIFRMFDVDNDGKITAAEIVTILAVFAKADTAAEKKEQARFLFDLWDYDGDGKIPKKEMREAYKAFNNHPGKTVAARAFTAAMEDVVAKTQRWLGQPIQVDQSGSRGQRGCLDPLE